MDEGKIEEMKATLVTLIMTELSFEFAEKHLAYNLINTIHLERREGKYIIDIPAEIYNMSQYIKTGVIQYRGTGSYANKLDKYGSRWHNHKGFVMRCINAAIEKWKKLYSLNTNTNIKTEQGQQ